MQEEAILYKNLLVAARVILCTYKSPKAPHTDLQDTVLQKNKHAAK